MTKGRGGYRPGAGRPKSGKITTTFTIDQDVAVILKLQSFSKTKSEYVNEDIRRFAMELNKKGTD